MYRSRRQSPRLRPRGIADRILGVIFPTDYLRSMVMLILMRALIDAADIPDEWIRESAPGISSILYGPPE